jgi:hypothetical protein
MELNKIYQGDCLAIMKTWPDACVDMCVTSPPFYALRNYQTIPVIWDEDQNCKHQWGDPIPAVGDIRYRGENAATGSDNNPSCHITPPDTNFCSKCGKPWERIIEKEFGEKKPQQRKFKEQDVVGNPMYRNGSHNDGMGREVVVIQKSWKSTCECNADIIPSIILDPFMGAGTTALVARKLIRNYVGIELNPDYIRMSEKRLREKLGMFL